MRTTAFKVVFAIALVLGLVSTVAANAPLDCSAGFNEQLIRGWGRRAALQVVPLPDHAPAGETGGVFLWVENPRVHI